MTRDAADRGATVVITHRVRDDRRADYERWLEEIGPVSRAAAGHLDSHIIRPVPGLTGTYTVVIRFDTEAHLRGWMQSENRNRLIAKAQPLLVSGDDFFVRSGLDFWFMPDGARAKVPVRWKQFLVTWSAIYPLALLVPIVVVPALRRIGVPDAPSLMTLGVTAVVVFLMVYVVMPRYTALVRRWLFS